MTVRIDVVLSNEADFPPEMVKRILAVLPPAMRQLAQDLAERTPRDTGVLAGGWRLLKIPFGVAIINVTPYARWVRKGRFSSFVSAVLFRQINRVILPKMCAAMGDWLTTREGLRWATGWPTGRRPVIEVNIGPG